MATDETAGRYSWDGEFAALCMRYLDGKTSDEEDARLCEELAASRGCRNMFVRASFQDGLLREVYAARRHTLPAGGAARRRPPARRAGAGAGALGLPQSVPRRWARWITAAAAAVLIGVGVLAWRAGFLPFGAGAELATVSACSGACYVRSGGLETPLRSGRVLEPTDAVRLGGGATTAVLALADGSRLELAAGCAIRFPDSATRRRKRVHVQSGTLRAEIAKQRLGHAMGIETPHAELRVLGTSFTVLVQPAATRVDLAEGQVRVVSKRSAESAVLHPGQTALVDDALRVMAIPRARGETRDARDQVRVSAGLLALYTFREAGGPVVRDVSGVGTPLDLRIEHKGRVQWLPGGGLRVKEPTRILSTQRAEKIARACKASDEITLEAWVQTWHTSQMGPARILSLAPTTLAPALYDHAMLGTYNLHLIDPSIAGPWYCARLRSTDNPQTWADHVLTEPDSVTTDLTHLVFARAANGELRFTINGVDRLWAQGDFELITRREIGLRTREGDFDKWGSDLHLCLVNWPQGEGRGWVGNLYLAAVYSRALSYAEIRQNYRAGPKPATEQARR